LIYAIYLTIRVAARSVYKRMLKHNKKYDVKKYQVNHFLEMFARTESSFNRLNT